MKHQTEGVGRTLRDVHGHFESAMQAQAARDSGVDQQVAEHYTKRRHPHTETEPETAS